MDDDSLRTSYDAVAARYVEHIYDELRQKPLDRHLLNRFAEEVRGVGPVVDLGCGPGHVARYLADQGVEVTGIDLSPEMVSQATKLNPKIAFRTGDMRALNEGDAVLAGIVAFYSIIHLTPDEMPVALRECRRVLQPRGVILLSFHIGDETVHLDELWGEKVSLEFYFLQRDAVVRLLEDAGFAVLETVERAPYEGAEYASRRCYLLARKS